MAGYPPAAPFARDHSASCGPRRSFIVFSTVPSAAAICLLSRRDDVHQHVVLTRRQLGSKQRSARWALSRAMLQDEARCFPARYIDRSCHFLPPASRVWTHGCMSWPVPELKPHPSQHRCLSTAAIGPGTQRSCHEERKRAGVRVRCSTFERHRTKVHLDDLTAARKHGLK
jgi:hypothetical protein